MRRASATTSSPRPTSATATAQRLRTLEPPGATVARLGGDEFAVLLTGTTAEQTGRLAGRIVLAFDATVAVGGRDLPIAASIGSAVGWPGADADEILRRADVAMYAAKSGGERGRTRHASYTSDIDHEFTARSQLEQQLRQAMLDNELTVDYQPIVELSTGRVVAVEALLRWTHPSLGRTPPAAFIPVAEQTGLIVPIGLWVLRTACAQAAAWYTEFGDDAPTVSVNVSAIQLRDDAFVDHATAILTEVGLAPNRLAIEITESTAIADSPTLATITALHNLGIRISLDDFGTGYSSLASLDQCPVDELKLGQSFTRSSTDPASRRVAGAVQTMARALDLDVVAEGVETRDEAIQLTRLGYRLAQGFLFAPPLPARQITARVADGASSLSLSSGR